MQKKLRGEAVVANPGKVAWAFDHFVHKWHVDVLYKECGWAEHFLRDEFAMLRGMTHAHCLGMLEGAPTISQIETAIKEIELSGARGGAECAKIFRWVEEHLGLTAWHPEHDRHEWPPPEGENAHPPLINHLRMGFDDVANLWEDECEDLITIVNKVLVHQHTDYCLKPRKLPDGRAMLDAEGKPVKGCRFQYDDGDFRRGCNCECHQKRTDVQVMHGVMPHPECQHCDRVVPPPRPRSDADADEPPQEPCSACQWRIELDRRGKNYLQAPRNHGRLVAFMAWFVCGVRANVDCQFILSQEALITYILKYQTKSEHKSGMFLQASAAE